eukprot:425558-Rhodomonas_salina.1
MAYGYGHLTWEWRRGIRTYSHPLIYASAFKILAIFGLDSPFMVGIAPGFISALFAALGDIATLHLALRLFGEETARLALLLQLGSACYFYCMARPLINAVETTLTTAAFSFWPWNHHTSLNIPERRLALFFGALACALRPTAVLLFLPLAAAHLFALRHRPSSLLLFLAEGLLIGGSALVASAL